MNVNETFYPTKESKKKHQIPLFYGRANETMKNEVPLPIEINIPKRFFNEGNSNILHWEKCCLFMSECRKEKKRERISWKSTSTAKKNCCSNGWETFNKQQLETLYAYLNKFNDVRSRSVISIMSLLPGYGRI